MKLSVDIPKVPMSDKIERLSVVVFFALYLMIGIAIHGDFGASWDETLNRDLGTATLSYIQSRFSGNTIPWSEVSQGLVAEMGPLFEMVLVVLEKALNLSDTRDILLMRHLVTFLTFWLGALAFYTLLRLRFNNRLICLLGVSLLVLTPRLFSHSFYNTKDIVLTALFIVGTLTMVRFLRERSLRNSALHALACAAAVDVRLVGLILPALTLLLLIIQLSLRDMGKQELMGTWICTGTYLMVLVAFIVLFWPALWENPVGMFLDRISRIASAKQIDNNFSLYMGSFVRVDQLPWHYLPVWILITLPVSYVLFFLAGVWTIGAKLAKGPLSSQDNVLNLAFLLLFLIPLLAVIIRKPILYDDWRHFYFLQPFIVAIALTGISELVAKPQLRKVVVAATLLMLVHGVAILIRYHPYENVYFSPLAGKDVEQKFELDYWGLSFQEGLKFVLRAQPQNTIRVHVSDFPGVVNCCLLDSSKRSRLLLVPLEEATYFLTNHRQPNHYADFRARRYPCINEVYAVRVAGATLLGVYKIR